MADFKVSTARLKSDAGSVKGYIDQMERKLTALRNDATQLDAMWDGPASESFKEAFNADLAALETMISNLKKLYNYEQMAKEKYESCETQVQSVVSDMK